MKFQFLLFLAILLAALVSSEFEDGAVVEDHNFEGLGEEEFDTFEGINTFNPEVISVD